MEEFQLNPFIFTALLSLIFFWSITRLTNLKHRSRRKLPPSPPKLPIIGNLHQLGSLPHQNLHSLAKKHGPLMLLHFGSVPVLIVSSAEWAREIMRTHDLVFANRPAYKVYKKLIYSCQDIACAPYGEYWRKMKSIFVEQLVSNQRVRSFQYIREEETALFVKEIQDSYGATVDLSAMFLKYSYDETCRSAFGRKYSGTENGKKFLLLLSEFMELCGCFDVGNFIPWLGWIGRVNGFDKRLDRVAKEMDQVFESVIQERIGAQKGESLLDILLQIYTDTTAEALFNREGVKSLILDVFVAGTDTTATTLEWAMAELMRHPTLLAKLQHEVRGIVKQNQDVTNDDIEKMHYLKAVIKETLRYRPASPLVFPRVASKDVQIKGGFDISAGTVVIVSAWAIGRDPMYWEEAEKFMPERFLNCSRDFRGLDFEYIPFGAGRRGCPGITFSLVAMEILLANLVHKFDWKLPDGIEAKDLDMNESSGITSHRLVPLLAVASPSK